MFSFIILLVVIVIAVIQSNRISRLEKMIKGPIQAAKPIPPIQTSTPVDIPQQYQAQSSAAASTRTSISGEEASGRFLGKIGIAAVLIGIAFFLKYAFDNNWIGEGGRIMIGIIAGLAFLGVGQYLRKKYLKYSDLLMGGGIAILYLSIFSAHFFYDLIDPFTTGVCLFIVTTLSFAISIANATQTLAIVSVVGGFATPFLVGSNDNAMYQLFGYLTVLNIGVLAVSFFKKWSQLNTLAFVGTYVNFFVWVSAFYTSEVLAPTLSFILVTFAIFLIASVARVIVSGAMVKANPLDYFLLGANAIATAIFGYVLLRPEYHGILGFASVLLAIIYCAVAFTANKYSAGDKALNIFLPGLAVVFLSIAVPVQFSGPWIAVAWLIEAVVLYVIASFINNRGFQVMGVIVYILGCVDFIIWSENQALGANFAPIANTGFIVMLLAIIAAYAIAYMYRRFGSISTEIQKRGIIAFVIVANIITLYAFTTQISMYHASLRNALSEQYRLTAQQDARLNTGYDTTGAQQEASNTYSAEVNRLQNQSNTLVSVFWSLYAALLTAIGFARRITSARRLGLVLFGLTAIKVVIDVWSLGQLYRIISFIVFGIVALIASFAYAKYKDRIKEII